MTPAIDTPSSYLDSTPTGSRLVSALAALAITALIVLMLVRLGLVTVQPPGGNSAIVVNLLPGKKDAQATQAPAKARTEQRKVERQQQAKPSAAPRPIVPPPPVAAKNAPWNVIWMSHDEMAAADISKMQGHHSERADAASGEASADASGAAGGAGGPPGPDRLFDADWYRRPTHAEMATYMPQMSQPGWGMVACRTAPDFRVEDCREIGESPGSHLARAVREASWQFRVLPPRVNGRPMIGAWVRIRFDITEKGDADASN
jgi:hypothetical protein